MANENICVLLGRLTKDPELKTSTNGKKFAYFTVAVNRPKYGDQQQQCDFLTCITWEGRADYLCNYGQKGQQVLVEGRIQTQQVTDSVTNSNNTIWEIVANKVELIWQQQDTAQEQQQAQPQQQRQHQHRPQFQPPTQSAEQQSEYDQYISDLPF